MSKAQNSSNTNSKAGIAFFSENAVTRTRASKSSDGGRYNAKTRRLVVPATFAGKSVAVASKGGIIVVGGEGNYACHPSQHFVTLPEGTVATEASVTLERTDLPKELVDAKIEAVAYKLPEA